MGTSTGHVGTSASRSGTSSGRLRTSAGRSGISGRAGTSTGHAGTPVQVGGDGACEQEGEQAMSNGYKVSVVTLLSRLVLNDTS